MTIAIRLTCATAACLLAALPAQALTLTFSGSGVVQGPAQTPPLFTGLNIGPADASYTFGAQAGWTIDVLFGGSLTPIGGYVGTMAGTFTRGADSLSFFGTQLTPLLGQSIALVYTITGGTGAYAGYTGSGSSNVALLGNPLGLPTPVPFLETDGVFNLTPIPEPGTWALWLAGLSGVVVAARRRRQDKAAQHDGEVRS